MKGQTNAQAEKLPYKLVNEKGYVMTLRCSEHDGSYVYGVRKVPFGFSTSSNVFDIEEKYILPNHTVCSPTWQSNNPSSTQAASNFRTCTVSTYPEIYMDAGTIAYVGCFARYTSGSDFRILSSSLQNSGEAYGSFGGAIAVLTGMGKNTRVSCSLVQPSYVGMHTNAATTFTAYLMINTISSTMEGCIEKVENIVGVPFIVDGVNGGGEPDLVSLMAVAPMGVTA